MPDCQASYILAYLFELGTTQGDSAITHSEIRAWMDNTGIELSSWEAQTIKRLSETYLHSYHVAKSKKAATPWEGAPYYMSAKWITAMQLKQSIRRASEI